MRAQRLEGFRLPTQLYFIECLCPGRPIKIGVAVNVRTRLGNLQAGSPYRLALMSRVPNAAHMEHELHQRFAQSRLVGEWFERTDEILSVICDLGGMNELEGTAPQSACSPDELMPIVLDVELQSLLDAEPRPLPLVRLTCEVGRP